MTKHVAESWLKRHMIQLLIMAGVVTAAFYGVASRVTAVEQQQKAHNEAASKAETGHKEEIQGVKKDIKELDKKVDQLGTKQAVANTDIEYIKKAIDDIKDAVTRRPR